MDKRQFIARNVAALLSDGDVVNLGVGIPTLASSFVPKDVFVLIHAENGAVGCATSNGYPWDLSSREAAIASREPWGGENGNYSIKHRDLCDASGDSITLIPGAACCDTVMAFTIARGGRLDATVLGALQVDEERNLANWKIPGKKLNGMGGAMDIVSGAKRVIIAMEHNAKNGEPKLVKRCSLPLTAAHCVNTIVTELCVIDCLPEGLTVVSMAPGVSREELLSRTEAELRFADQVDVMLPA
jgi:acetate CoA/acetoacetate CoA-transferase beta subunit